MLTSIKFNLPPLLFLKLRSGGFPFQHYEATPGVRINSFASQRRNPPHLTCQETATSTRSHRFLMANLSGAPTAPQGQRAPRDDGTFIDPNIDSNAALQAYTLGAESQSPVATTLQDARH
jgi:hypothetical protein